MFDPFQNYAAMGNYPAGTPFQPTYNPLQAGGINPMAGYGPGSYAGVPPQLHLASILAARAMQAQLQGSPWTTGLQPSPFHTGVENPLLNPILAQQYGQNPLVNPTLAQQYGQNPLVNPILAQQYGQNPLVNPILAQQYGQNPLVNPILAQQYGQTPTLNPIVAHQFAQNPLLTNPLLSQQFGQGAGQQFGQGLGQVGSPFGQFGQGLAPQSWIGQPGIYGGGQGQVLPLIAQQFAGRGWHNAGLYPWTTF